MAIGPVTEGTEPSIGQLVASIKEDVSGLVHDEIALAKAEMRAEAKSAAVGGALVAVAVMLGLLATVLLSFALVYGVAALGLTRGWAFVVVGVVYIAFAGAFGWIAKSQFEKVKGPQRTKASTQRVAAALRPTSSP